MEEKTNFFEKFWYLFVILAIVLVGVVAGLWFYNQKSLHNLQQTSVPVEEVNLADEGTDAQTAALESQSESDEIVDIEADLQNTDLSNLDKEVADIEEEINTP